MNDQPGQSSAAVGTFAGHPVPGPVWRRWSAFGRVVAMTTMLPTPRLLAEGFVMVESARWHDGRLWFAHWGAGEVLAVDLEGRVEVVAPGRTRMGWAIDWLPD